MRKLFTLLLAFILTQNISFGQGGLEDIVVEKFYLSNEEDTAFNEDGGELPEEATTYRVYVDMKPGYIFQAAYAIPGNDLKIGTTTKFFNNEDRGSTFANNIDRNRLDENTVMLDTWLSVGAACDDCIGVLKAEDDGVDNIVNSDGILQNNDLVAGIPLTKQDGQIAGMPESPTAVGISSELGLFDTSNDGPIPSEFLLTDGSWASLNGSGGADSMENKVLIGQFTTDGLLSFELNIQIRNDAVSPVVIENYVAADPTGNEFTIPALTYADTVVVSSTEDLLYIVEDQINLYPNPSSEEVIIEIIENIDYLSGAASFDVYSSNGSLLYSGMLTNNLTTLNLSQYADGLYFINIHTGKATVKKRFLKISNK